MCLWWQVPKKTQMEREEEAGDSPRLLAELRPLIQHHQMSRSGESCRTLEMRGCLQDRQSSQEDTSWWDSTSTRLR